MWEEKGKYLLTTLAYASVVSLNSGLRVYLQGRQRDTGINKFNPYKPHGARIKSGLRVYPSLCVSSRLFKGRYGKGGARVGTVKGCKAKATRHTGSIYLTHTDCGTV